MECLLVSHTHWDREWYRTREEFRARLVDVIDAVLALAAEDPGYRFHLDGQAVVLEDYLALRPDREAALRRACGAGQLAIGPWYVQPDSFLPSGEAHVRNLLEGRRVASRLGPVSRVAYTPDSFGHPAQFPQLFAGFGIPAFVYWRGNGNELDDLPSEYRWAAPDGSEVIAVHLAGGYFSAAALPEDTGAAVARLVAAADRLAPRGARGAALLLNGADHLFPERRTRALAAALADATGWNVRRVTLDEALHGISRDIPRHAGELRGARVAHLLPGVWSARMPLKQRNRACEAELEQWAEPWAAFGRVLGLADERPALRLAWRALLENQAHDSIGGCSQDAVHAQMQARFDTAFELARETTRRVLERLAGLDLAREVPWREELEVAVFNASPHPQSGVVRARLEGYPPFRMADEHEVAIHPLEMAGFWPRGFTVDGRPTRLVGTDDHRRLRLVPGQDTWGIEFVAEDVPAFGWRGYRLVPSEPHPDEEDDGRIVHAGELTVEASEDGTFGVHFGERRFEQLGALEDVGDRGDSYDFDPVPGEVRVESVAVRRRRHPTGVQHLEIRRRLMVPESLDEERTARSETRVPLEVVLEARVAPGVPRVELEVRVENNARDHRLRLLFPTRRPAPRFLAASTFDLTERSSEPPRADGWRHAAPATFPHHGWLHVNGLTVAAPGLPEAEVTAEGTVAITLLRSVGWLSRADLTTRPGLAGPAMPVPGAQCLGTFRARLSLSVEPGLAAARSAESGLRAVPAGEAARLPAGTSLLRLAPSSLVLSALKPAEDGGGLVLRVLNPTDAWVQAEAALGFDVADARAVNLDESEGAAYVELDGRALRWSVAPRALSSVRLTATEPSVRPALR